jgi:hypothetical protein
VPGHFFWLGIGHKKTRLRGACGALVILLLSGFGGLALDEGIQIVRNEPIVRTYPNSTKIAARDHGADGRGSDAKPVGSFPARENFRHVLFSKKMTANVAATRRSDHEVYKGGRRGFQSTVILLRTAIFCRLLKQLKMKLKKNL